MNEINACAGNERSHCILPKVTQLLLTISAGKFRIAASFNVVSRIARMCQTMFVKKREMAVLLNRREIYYSRHEAQTSSLPGRFHYIRIYTCMCVSSPLRISRSLDQLKPFLRDVRSVATNSNFFDYAVMPLSQNPSVSLYRIVKQ